jgi:hypothetical protein
MRNEHSSALLPLLHMRRLAICVDLHCPLAAIFEHSCFRSLETWES